MRDYRIIEAGPEWADRYRLFCQHAYQYCYVRPELGITADLFSPEVFDSKSVRQYFTGCFTPEANQRAWLAIDRSDQVLGGIVAYNHPEFCEIRGFYVAPERKSQGIGRALYEHVVTFSGARPMQLDVVNYMTDTIAMYKHWGFAVDESKGNVLYDWEGWPEALLYARRGIYMTKPGVASGSDTVH